MKLKDFLEKEGISNAEFAKRIGVSKMTISRYVRGEAIPKPDIMRRIVKDTKNKVTANDFYK